MYKLAKLGESFAAHCSISGKLYDQYRNGLRSERA